MRLKFLLQEVTSLFHEFVVAGSSSGAKKYWNIEVSNLLGLLVICLELKGEAVLVVKWNAETTLLKNQRVIKPCIEGTHKLLEVLFALR
jgi:hypothetical protein